ncbi:MAG: hypothetical protein LBT73_02950 [Tannerellaceae bacterium]|jgi:hypothetical protein|nr:hypothetical protein [Tannerellaceae bacterium]
MEKVKINVGAASSNFFDAFAEDYPIYGAGPSIEAVLEDMRVAAGMVGELPGNTLPESIRTGDYEFVVKYDWKSIRKHCPHLLEELGYPFPRFTAWLRHRKLQSHPLTELSPKTV